MRRDVVVDESLSAAVRDRIVVDARKGLSGVEIAKRNEVSVWMVRKVCRQRGIVLPGVGDVVEPLPERVFAAVLAHVDRAGQLPSPREVTVELGLSPVAVRQAVRDLVDRGWLLRQDSTYLLSPRGAVFHEDCRVLMGACLRCEVPVRDRGLVERVVGPVVGRPRVLSRGGEMDEVLGAGLLFLLARFGRPVTAAALRELVPLWSVQAVHGWLRRGVGAGRLVPVGVGFVLVSGDPLVSVGVECAVGVVGVGWSGGLFVRLERVLRVVLAGA